MKQIFPIIILLFSLVNPLVFGARQIINITWQQQPNVPVASNEILVLGKAQNNDIGFMASSENEFEFLQNNLRVGSIFPTTKSFAGVVPQINKLDLALTPASAVYQGVISQQQVYLVTLPNEVSALLSNSLNQTIENWNAQFPDFWFQPNFIYQMIKTHVPPFPTTTATNFNSQVFDKLLQHDWSFFNNLEQTFIDTANLDYRWDMELMQLEQAHAIAEKFSTKIKPVKVAVLDTGFFSRHPALTQMADPLSIYHVVYYNGAKTYTSKKEYEPAVKGKRINPKTSQYEDYSVTGGWHDWVGHGTHVAGTIAGAVVPTQNFLGVAPGFTIMPVKILDDEGSGTTSEILQGVYYAQKMGATVMNMSLGGGGKDRISERAFAEMEAKGVVVVAAAGNSYEDGNPTFYPAAYPSTLAVASLGSDNFISYFSQAGSWVDVAAPGGDGHKKNKHNSWRQIFSTFTADPKAATHTSRSPKEEGDDGKYYTGMSGTSMAAPHVSGLVAWIKSIRPEMKLSEVRALLQATGEVPKGAFYDAQLIKSPNAKIVNAQNLLQQLLVNAPTPNPEPSPNPNPGPGPIPVPSPQGVWNQIAFQPNTQLATNQIVFSKARLNVIGPNDLVYSAPTDGSADLSNPASEKLSLIFSKSIFPSDQSFGEYMELWFKINGSEIKVNTVFFDKMRREGNIIWQGTIGAQQLQIKVLAETTLKTYVLSVVTQPLH